MEEQPDPPDQEEPAHASGQEELPEGGKSHKVVAEKPSRSRSPLAEAASGSSPPSATSWNSSRLERRTSRRAERKTTTRMVPKQRKKILGTTRIFEDAILQTPGEIAVCSTVCERVG